MEEFARLAIEASKLTEQSAQLTKNVEVIDAATISHLVAQSVHSLAIEIRTHKPPELKLGLKV